MKLDILISQLEQFRELWGGDLEVWTGGYYQEVSGVYIEGEVDQRVVVVE